MRGLGRTYHNPTPSEALSRVRLLIAARDADFVVDTAPVRPHRDEDDEDEILAEAGLQQDHWDQMVVQGDEHEWLESPPAGDDNGEEVVAPHAGDEAEEAGAPRAGDDEGEEAGAPRARDEWEDVSEDEDDAVEVDDTNDGLDEAARREKNDEDGTAQVGYRGVEGDVFSLEDDDSDDDMVVVDPTNMEVGTGIESADAAERYYYDDDEIEDGDLPDPDKVYPGPEAQVGYRGVEGNTFSLEDDDDSDDDMVDPTNMEVGTGLESANAAECYYGDDEIEDGDLPDPDKVTPGPEEVAGGEIEPEKEKEPVRASMTNPQTEGYLYWAGWLANKFRYKYRNDNFGLPTAELDRMDYTREFGEVPAWIGALSKGGLTVPSKSFKKLLEKFELVFRDLHGDTLSYEKGIVCTLRETILARVPEAKNMPDVVRTYARSRFFLRLRHLNFLRKERLAEKKKERMAKKRAKQAAAAGPKPKKTRKPRMTGSAGSRHQRKTKALTR